MKGIVMKHILGLLASCCTLGLSLAAPAPAPVVEKLQPIDLQSKANLKLTGNLGTGAEGNNLKELPTGAQTFGGIKFTLGEGLVQLGSKVVDKMPAKIEGIKVDKHFAKLHILHATNFGGGPNQEGTPWFVKDDTLIGEYRVNFEDKSSVTIPIIYGKDVRDWFYIDGEKEPSRGKVVWKGDNNRAKLAGARIRLYLTTWENTVPEKKVVSIDYLSKKDDTVAAPFCLALTLEAK
jgi:hypothetical protein